MFDDIFSDIDLDEGVHERSLRGIGSLIEFITIEPKITGPVAAAIVLLSCFCVYYFEGCSADEDEDFNADELVAAVDNAERGVVEEAALVTPDERGPSV